MVLAAIRKNSFAVNEIKWCKKVGLFIALYIISLYITRGIPNYPGNQGIVRGNILSGKSGNSQGICEF